MGERILLIRLSAVGDVVNTLPALALLRRARPRAHLGFAIEDRAADLVLGHPMVDAVHVFPRRRWRESLRRGPARWGALGREARAYVRSIRAERYEVSLDFQGNLKGALHALASGAPRRIGFDRGFDREGAHLFATERVRPPVDRPHRVEKFVSLLAPLGVAGEEREFVLPDAPAARERARLWGEALGLGGRPLVAIHPGTSARGAAKRWPEDRFAAAAARLAGESGADVLVTWGPGERALAERVASGAGGGAVRVSPETGSLLELAELLRLADVLVAADTGPTHLAAACGTPCVALFGPKDPAVYRPFGEGHAVVRPARSSDVRDIGVDEVVDAAERLLGR